MSPFLLDPLGFRLDGRPFWGFSGAEGEDDGNDDDLDADDNEGEEKDPVKKLQATLDKVSAERRAARDEFRPYKATLRELGIQSPEQLKELLTKGTGASGAGKQQEQVDIEKVKADARAEVQLETNRELALARVEAAAKGMFADPDDAVDHLRKNVDDLLGRDGKPDKAAIKRELAELLAAKPHWGAKQDGNMDFDGGARQPAGQKLTMDGFLRQVSRTKRGG